MTKEEISKAFENDVREIARRLIAAFDLAHAEANATSLDDPLIRWLDFRLRYIEPKVRRIERSNRFPVQLPAEMEKALRDMEQRVLQGEDLNPYQSKTIAKNDTSGLKRQQRTDGLWADWGIHHLHLAETSAAPDERFSVRSGWLLFVMVYDDVLAFVDVRDHGEASLWTQEDLVKTFIDSWPEQAERFRLRGVIASTGSHTPEELAKLRGAGINRFITHAGATYMGMGQGVSSASTATKATLFSNKILANVRRLAEWAADHSGPIMTDLRHAGITQPKLSLFVHPQGLMFFEEGAQMGWPLRRETEHADGVLHDALLPPWAVAPLVRHWGANP
ncbi:hypothetical protein ACSFBF_03995 [Variovorax sp. ZT5P49]|uniref:hypothetical protein n=1 Tax=Variovorax sp. ZT5P49 TaxID=3443733 RepID=UPI003F483538